MIENDSSPCLVRLCNVIYRCCGKISAGYPRTVILICLAITGLLTYKVATTPQVSAMDGYASDDDRSKIEYHIFQQFLNTDGEGIALGILLHAHDNGSMIREEYLSEVVNILDTVSSKFLLYNEDTKKNESFEEFCSGFCQASEPVRQFHNGMKLLSSNDSDSISNRIHLAYPTSNMFGRNFSLLPNFFGVETNSDGTLKSSNLLLLIFRAEKKRSWTKQMVKNWELTVGDYFQKNYTSKLVVPNCYSTHIVEKEIVRQGDILMPFMLVGFVIMSVFCSITTIISGVTVYGQKATLRKIILSVTACVNSFMACGCAFGIMFLCGIHFSPLLCITPFLVLAISVDDSFLMIHAWNRLMLSDVKMSRKDAICEVLVQTGAAITISALTNILAFVIGVLTSPPEIRIFCIGNAACIVMDVIFQATFFTAAMFLLADEPVENYDAVSADNLRTKLRKLTKKYVRIWSKPIVSYSLFFLWVLYIAGAIYGLFKIHVDLSSDKMFPPDSPIIEIDRLRSQSVVPHYSAVMIVVNNPGDLTNRTNIEGLMDMKRAFESTRNAIGPESTKMFLTDYVEFLDSMSIEGMDSDVELDAEGEEGESNIETFLDWPEYSFWRGFVALKNRTVTSPSGNKTIEKYVEKFMFSTGYHGAELESWNERGELLKVLRKEIDKYPQFNASVFTDTSFYLDILERIPTATWQSVVVTFICVIIVCMFFISHPTTVAVVSLAILSTSLGVFGYLSLFGISLDPVMMSISIMCIGFSVDIPAHVSFHYFATKLKSSSSPNLALKSSTEEEEEELEHRLTHTLSSVGFPVIQAGISTDLCTLPLVFVNLYMAQVFAWSLMFCVTLSLIHGLVFIPLLFSVQYHLKQFFRRFRQNRVSDQ